MGRGNLNVEHVLVNDGEATISTVVWRKHCTKNEMYDLASIGSLIR